MNEELAGHILILLFIIVIAFAIIGVVVTGQWLHDHVRLMIV